LIDPGAAAVGAATGVFSSVIPYSLELEALRRIAVGTFGVSDEHGAGRGRPDRNWSLSDRVLPPSTLSESRSWCSQGAGVLGSSVGQAPTEV